VEAADTIRMLLTVHYDGAAFHGWQVQPGLRTVQGELQKVLSRLADAPRTLLGSGRTDAGVHATGQAATVDMPAHWTPLGLRTSLNAMLAGDLWVESVHAVPADLHPRYDAVARTYTYDVGLLPRAASPFHNRWCWPLREPVDRALLAAAADVVAGRHSFEAYAKTGQPERGDRCLVHAAGWTEWSLGARLTITADRFLHHMVRYLVGTMIDVARRRRPLDDVAGLLEGRRGLTTSPPAPPEGLFLTRVEYPEGVLLGPDATLAPERSATTA
jgi:tRNA pseudouridine38-40 synthase